MDWRLYHSLNATIRRHEQIGHVFDVLTTFGVIALVLATIALWFLARPGREHWKLASVAGLAAGALAYVLNQVIHTLHDRARPYEAHAGVWHPYANGSDASFPSDHSSAAFGIAWAVFLVDRTIGALLLGLAALVGVGRLVTGAHYPGDVLAGVLVGLVAALIVVRLSRPLLERLVRLLERVTDPLLRPLRRRSA